MQLSLQRWDILNSYHSTVVFWSEVFVGDGREKKRGTVSHHFDVSNSQKTGIKILLIAIEHLQFIEHLLRIRYYKEGFWLHLLLTITSFYNKWSRDSQVWSALFTVTVTVIWTWVFDSNICSINPTTQCPKTFIEHHMTANRVYESGTRAPLLKWCNVRAKRVGWLLEKLKGSASGILAPKYSYFLN